MASHFSANQYEQAFDSRRLQNWELPKRFKERPDSYDGFTQIIANDRGHLIEGVPKSKESPWGTFVGTWDMPRKIPGNITTYMARNNGAVDTIKTEREVHERYMKYAASPLKHMEFQPQEPQTNSSPFPGKSVQERPLNPSPHSPNGNKPKTPPPSEATAEEMSA